MPAVEIEIINKLGLHARASAKFVGIAGQFPCQIQAGRTPESMVDGKSIMAMMMLAAGKGKRYFAETEGAIRYVVADNGEKGLTFAVEPIKLALSETLESNNK